MILITTKNGELVRDGEIIKSESFQPSQKFVDGDLSIEASVENIQAISESLLQLFVRPMGMTLKKHSKYKWDYPLLDVVKKYQNGTYPPKRTTDNLTRGWCYLVSGVLHRFFYRSFDLYKVLCPLTPKGVNDDYHWWLQSKCGEYVIDLTEEQYLKEGIKNVRDGGKKKGAMGNSYGKKTRNMAYVVATHRDKSALEFPLLKTTGYTKKYPELIQTIKSGRDVEAFDEKKHARIYKIKFHTEHLNSEGQLHLEKEMSEYWKSSYIEFDPNESLDKPIELIQKLSDELFQKSDYFLLKTLVLTSNQTNKKLVEQSFFTHIEHKFGSIPERKVFDQTIRIRNLDHARLSGDHQKINSLMGDLDEQFLELKAIQEKILKTQDEFNYMQEMMRMKNILPSSEFIKRQYRRQIFEEEFKFLDLPQPPWEKQGLTMEEW